ncbi:MAG TPA: response regulator [Opitutaceae bacterium]|nr:response regulator [Opitutaceae bacterium]
MTLVVPPSPSTIAKIEPGIVARPSLSVIVADDSVESQLTIRKWLEEIGHFVICVSGGHEAARVISQRAVDIIIAEVIMPNGDGLELMAHVRKLGASVPMIAISGGGRYLASSDCLRVARGFGAKAGVPKPLVRAELLAAIDQVIAGRRVLG